MDMMGSNLFLGKRGGFNLDMMERKWGIKFTFQGP